MLRALVAGGSRAVSILLCCCAVLPHASLLAGHSQPSLLPSPSPPPAPFPIQLPVPQWLCLFGLLFFFFKFPLRAFPFVFADHLQQRPHVVCLSSISSLHLKITPLFHEWPVPGSRSLFLWGFLSPRCRLSGPFLGASHQGSLPSPALQSREPRVSAPLVKTGRGQLRAELNAVPGPK